ncbi:MAG: D-2-hydroxyacid dehydrogenase [Acholeplasmataceae bacterium]|nr:D-2-hydroxyacid dehydrogenase [Acholeplasmataceae bacterium]
MKIFLKTDFLKEKYAKRLRSRFPDIEIITDDIMSFDCEAIICSASFLKPQTLDLYKNLRWIQLLSAGYDTIDINDIHQRQITLTNARDVYSIQIAEDVFSKILAFNRNTKQHFEHMKTGDWQYQKVTHEIAHSKVGILGTGSIAIEIAKRMKAFDAQTIGYKRTLDNVPFFDVICTKPTELDWLYAECDYLIIALPLTTETKHLISSAQFAKMKPSCLVINIARGEIIDQDALVDALRNHLIRGAALDVVTPEPLPTEHPLWYMDNVLITPHNAGSSPHMLERLYQMVEDNVHRYVNHQNLYHIIGKQ